MEKVLRLYKIPDVGDIVTVIGVGDTQPIAGFSEGDLFIDTSDDGLYEAQDDGQGGLEWVQVSFDTTKYYRDGSADMPEFYTYSSQYGLNEYDVSFPANADRVAEITTFTYNATRMGNAPTISGTLMYRQCLDELWDDRVCVFFNKKFYFIDKIPSSEYSNADQRYKHSCEFVSENRLLENVYFTNVVDIEHYEGDITKLPMQWLEFSFFGGITEFVARLNLSLAYSGLDAQHVGFRVVKDALETTYEQMISISDTTLKAALDLIYETWGIPYWFDGYTIHIGYSNEQQMQQAGVTMPTFRYGAVQSLLSLQKSQSNDIVNRITGFGSEENIPYFYPNKNPNALELRYQDGEAHLQSDMAYIANPYRTVSLTPTESWHGYVPNGSYFKYMPIQKTYTYDQFLSINPHVDKTITEEDGIPQLATLTTANYYVRTKYYTQNYGGVDIIGHTNQPEYVFACKTMWVWLRDGDLVSLVLEDKMNPLETFRTTIAGSSYYIYIKAKTHNYTREQFEYFSENSSSYNFDGSADILDRYCQETYVSNHRRLKWDDDTITGLDEYYDVLYPLTLNSLPTGTTCISFTVGIKMKYPAVHADDTIIRLKTDTQTIIKHSFYDSDPDWSLNGDGHATNLWRYGIRLYSGVTPQEDDIIYFTREAGALPSSSRLLPYSFRVTNDIWLNAINSHYEKENGQSFYTFENLYKISCAKEHVENFDDIKPTIKGMTNNETPAKRIDQILDVTFDQGDNNDLDASGENYQHPYFFVKLAKTSANDGYGFNLFDCAIEGQTMTLNMADGNCGGCTFEVMVKYQSDGMAINPVGVFEQDTTINGVTYLQGTPKRDLSTGRVLTNRNESGQQDTSAAEVWIALKKDADTFGNYGNGLAVVLPDSARGQNFIPNNGDSFTIINICLPYAYIVAAEQRLYYALLDYMEQNNPRTWSFNIKFSSIYYKKHYEFMDKWLNESSRVPFVYNGITRTYYVQSYNYKVTNTSALPEVTIELQEKVKKRNVYYPVPYNPYENIAVEESVSQNRLKRIVSDFVSGLRPQDSEFDNVKVNGDITLADGTSLNGQITAINSQIFSNEKILTPENTWSKVKDAAEADNLFIDGLFKGDSPRITTSNATTSVVSSGVYDGKAIDIQLHGTSSYALFEQKIDVAEYIDYTFAFYAKARVATTAKTKLVFFNSSDVEIQTEEFFSFDVSTSWQRFTFLQTAPQYASYAKLQIQNDSEDVDYDIYISGVMVFADNFTTKDQDGNTVESVKMPSGFKYSIQDFLAQGGGGSSDNVFVCTLTSNTNPCTMDKTTYEIAQAVAAGKEVVCIDPYNSKVYRIVDAKDTANTQIHFGSIYASTAYNLYSNIGSERWHKFSSSLQIQLSDSGASQNIQTINNQSL